MHKHWSEQLADRVIKEKEEPYVVSSGMTTSGPAHFGTICEFLFPATIGKMLKKHGKKARVLMVGDILDAFDNIPGPMKQYEEQLVRQKYDEAMKGDSKVIDSLNVEGRNTLRNTVPNDENFLDSLSGSQITRDDFLKNDQGITVEPFIELTCSVSAVINNKINNPALIKTAKIIVSLRVIIFSF